MMGHPADVSAAVGMKHDEAKPRFDLIPPIAELEVAKVLEYGVRKYDANNWRYVEITLHPCYTLNYDKSIKPMTTTGGHQLYAMPGGAKHTERKLDVLMWDKHRAKRKGVKDPERVTFPNGAQGWEFDYEKSQQG